MTEHKNNKIYMYDRRYKRQEILLREDKNYKDIRDTKMTEDICDTRYF